ncbi:MAG: type VI secretion system contractile sheath large subunit [Planctomycetes bacterium]|nr:type VI secretion system contractile sheath large subunit [Planctomycetota bacterium]
MSSLSALGRAATTVTEAVPAFNLLDAILAQPPADGTRSAPLTSDRFLTDFLSEKSPWNALLLWLGGQIPECPRGELRRKLSLILGQEIAQLDGLLGKQLNAVLHHAAFQKLESAWRGLAYLVEQVPEGAPAKVRILNASWQDLVRDQERALEFDQSHLFRKVYTEEFGTPGGEPFSLLIGNYDVTHRPYPNHPTDDPSALRGIMQVAAASFAPFVTGVDPRLLELEAFTQLEQPFDLSPTFEQPDYIKWRALRETEDSRFLGLVIPRVLYRAPHGDGAGHTHHFPFREETSRRDQFLWGNGSFALAAVVIRTFSESGWPANIRGVKPGQISGGVVAGLPALGFHTGRGDSPRAVTDIQLTDVQEKALSELGFISICHCPETGQAAFYTTPSVQKPKQYDDAVANANARLSAMMQYMLCVSRFAHYLKVMIRDRVGSFVSPSDCEDSLKKWLQNYVVSNDSATEEMKARYPLREGRVQVRENPGSPGKYLCNVYLRPHFQLDQLSAGIKLTTQLNVRTNE